MQNGKMPIEYLRSGFLRFRFLFSVEALLLLVFSPLARLSLLLSAILKAASSGLLIVGLSSRILSGEEMDVRVCSPSSSRTTFRELDSAASTAATDKGSFAFFFLFFSFSFSLLSTSSIDLKIES